MSALQRIYDASPAFMQNVMVSFYGVKLWRREYGTKFKRLLDIFEQHLHWTADELAAYQDNQVRVLLEHSYVHVPYYRCIMDERGLRPRDIACRKDLRKLPLLTRQDVKDRFQDLIASNIPHHALVHGHTSGTTGSPLQFYWDEYACLVKNVVDWRQKGLAGIQPGDRMAFLLGRVVVPIAHKHPPFWRHNWVLNHLFFSSFHLSQDTADLYIKRLEEFAPLALEGYPSTMFLMAKLVLQRGKTLPLKAVFTSSETLFPEQREAIESAFQCKVFDFYGMAERVVFATDCRQHIGKHLNADYGVTEVLNERGDECQPGEMGRIVATGLHNFAMPLIRYQTSDVTILQAKRCPCGCAFPLMENITTKDEDIISTKDGRYISSSVLTHPFKPLKGIVESQIIQEDVENVVVKVVKLPCFTPDQEQALVDGLSSRLGPGMSIRVEYVDRVTRTAAGKLRWVISKVPLKF